VDSKINTTWIVKSTPPKHKSNNKNTHPQTWQCLDASEEYVYPVVFSWITWGCVDFTIHVVLILLSRLCFELHHPSGILSLIIKKKTLLISLIGTLLNYFAFYSFDFERTWWGLFQKRVVRSKFNIYVKISRHQLEIWWSQIEFTGDAIAEAVSGYLRQSQQGMPQGMGKESQIAILENGGFFIRYISVTNNGLSDNHNSLNFPFLLLWHQWYVTSVVWCVPYPLRGQTKFHGK
jgi:hypothetical protein